MYFDTQLVITVLPYFETGKYRGTRYPEFFTDGWQHYQCCCCIDAKGSSYNWPKVISGDTTQNSQIFISHMLLF